MLWLALTTPVTVVTSVYSPAAWDRNPPHSTSPPAPAAPMANWAPMPATRTTTRPPAYAPLLP